MYKFRVCIDGKVVARGFGGDLQALRETASRYIDAYKDSGKLKFVLEEE